MTAPESTTRRIFEARGTWTAIVTPFTAGPAPLVDYAALDGLVDDQIRGGVDAIVACGTTGESPTLTHDEHDAVVEGLYGLPIALPGGVDHDRLVALMTRDKKAVDGLTFVLDGEAGVEVVAGVSVDAVRAALAAMP